MVNLTIGVGGDYAGPAEAYAFLVALGPMADDYTFDLISNVTIDAWPGGLVRIDCNGHRLLFTCSHNESIPDRPDLWYRVVLSGASGTMLIVHDPGSDVNDVINIEWWYYEHATANAVNMLDMRSWGGTEVITWSVENCWFEGNGTVVDVGINTANARHYYNIRKVAMFNITISLDLSPGSFIPGDDFPGRKHVRNVTIYTADIGGARGIDINDGAGNNIYFENVAVFQRGAGSVCWFKTAGANPDRFRTTNCSDDDNTIVTNMAPSTTITDCLANLIIADELESIVDTSVDFLKLKLGTVAADFTREPAGNVEVNQKIKFTPSVTVTPGAANLNDGGIPVVGMTTDIRGKTIPSINGEYPIGAHVQEYIT